MNEEQFKEHIAELRRQTALLEALQNQKQSLGFCNRPGRTTLYCNRSHKGLDWYLWDHDASAPKAAPGSAVCGFVRAVELDSSREYKGEAIHKLQVTMDAGSPIILEAGIKTLFAKGLLLAIHTIGAEGLRSPITVAPRPGDDESVLFCDVFADGQKVICEWPQDQGDRDFWNQTFKSAKNAVKDAHPHE